MSPGWACGDDHAESSPVQDPRLVPQQTEGCKRWKIQPGGWPTRRPPHNLVKGYISDVKKGTWKVTQSSLNSVPVHPEIWPEFYTLTEMRGIFGCMSPQPRALDWWPPLFWLSGSVLLNIWQIKRKEVADSAEFAWLFGLNDTCVLVNHLSFHGSDSLDSVESKVTLIRLRWGWVRV